MTDGEKPRGRQAVMDALLDAAGMLFAKRGTAAVSVRDIATEAGVNHGLIHRHFGSKQALLRAVMHKLTSEISGAIEDQGQVTKAPPSFFASAQHDRYWRVLARALLDGEDPRDMQKDFPVVRRIVEETRAAQERGKLASDVDVRLLTAMGVALGLGWLVFEPFIHAATQLGEEDSSALRAQAFVTWRKMLAALK